MPIQTDMNINMGYTPQMPKANFNTITHHPNAKKTVQNNRYGGPP